MRGYQLITIYLVTLMQLAIGALSLTDIAADGNIEFHATSSVQFDSNLGPISSVLENVATNTAAVNDEIKTQVIAKVDRILALLHGNTEIVIGDAMNALTDSLVRVGTMLTWQNCSQSWTMTELFERINRDLGNCTQQIGTLRSDFLAEMNTYTEFLQSSTEDILDLANLCYEEDSTFASVTTCFTQKLGKINELITAKINMATNVLMRTAKQSVSHVDEAKKCTAKVVADVVDFLEKSFEKC